MSDLGDYWRDVKEHFRDVALHPEKHFTKTEIKAYEERCARRKAKAEKAEADIEKLANALCLELKKYPDTGQYSFGKILDWWTTTGTAIGRKSRKRYNIGFTEVDVLKVILQAEALNIK